MADCVLRVQPAARRSGRDRRREQDAPDTGAAARLPPHRAGCGARRAGPLEAAPRLDRGLTRRGHPAVGRGADDAGSRRHPDLRCPVPVLRIVRRRGPGRRPCRRTRRWAVRCERHGEHQERHERQPRRQHRPGRRSAGHPRTVRIARPGGHGPHLRHAGDGTRRSARDPGRQFLPGAEGHGSGTGHGHRPRCRRSRCPDRPRALPRGAHRRSMLFVARRATRSMRSV